MVELRQEEPLVFCTTVRQTSCKMRRRDDTFILYLLPVSQREAAMGRLGQGAGLGIGPGRPEKEEKLGILSLLELFKHTVDWALEIWERESVEGQKLDFSSCVSRLFNKYSGWFPATEFSPDNGFQLAFVLPSAQGLKKVAEIEVLRNKTGLSFALYFSKRIDEGSTVAGGQWASPGSAGCETLCLIHVPWLWQMRVCIQLHTDPLRNN